MASLPDGHLLQRGVYPGRHIFQLTRIRLVQFLSKRDARGITQKIGRGKVTRRAVVTK